MMEYVFAEAVWTADPLPRQHFLKTSENQLALLYLQYFLTVCK